MCVQILDKERELDAVKTRNEYLVNRIRETVEKHKMEEEDLQVADGPAIAVIHIHTRPFAQQDENGTFQSFSNKSVVLCPAATGAYRGQ